VKKGKVPVEETTTPTVSPTVGETAAPDVDPAAASNVVAEPPPPPQATAPNVSDTHADVDPVVEPATEPVVMEIVEATLPDVATEPTQQQPEPETDTEEEDEDVVATNHGRQWRIGTHDNLGNAKKKLHFVNGL